MCVSPPKYGCIDVGLKRIGFSTALSGIVIPQKPILRKNRNQASMEVSKALKHHDISILVVGLPMGEGADEAMQRRIRHFVDLLDFDKVIHFHDESFSSFEAKQLATGLMRQKRDGQMDSLAAKVILQSFLNQIAQHV